MTPFKYDLRRILRGLLVNGVGATSSVAPGIHILAGHYMSQEPSYDKDVFLTLLDKLSKQARFVRIEDACLMIEQREDVDEPLIAFTFDDGFEDCYLSIVPALEKHRTNAAFFINPGFSLADDKNSLEFSRILGVPGKKPMRPAEIRRLAESGFIIGAHTIDHVDLRTTEVEFLKKQIVDCKVLVEEISGNSCEWFAWTYGGYKHISDIALKIALDHYNLVFSSDDHHHYTGKNNRVLNRRHFEPFWSSREVQFFTRKKELIEISVDSL